MLYAAGYILNTTLSAAELISAVGYSLTSHCVGVVLTHAGAPLPGSSTLVFALAALAAARLGGLLYSRTADKKQGALVGGLAAAMHLSFQGYLAAL